MKLISYVYQDRRGFGLLEAAQVFDLGNLGPDMRSAIPELMSLSDQAIRDSAEPLCTVEDIQFLPPVPNPRKMFITGWNYQDHAKETKTDVPPEPVVLARYPDSVVGHGQPLLKPLASETYDFEGELAVIIGRGGRRIARESVAEHLFGFSCFMEGSVRQYQGYSPTAGKNFFHSGAFGPWIIKGSDASAFHLRTLLNGDVVQETDVSQMVYDIPHLVSHISEFTPLSPGDVIATGTPAGVGARREPKLWLQAGDVVEVDISGVGRLVNQIEDERAYLETQAPGAAK